jgi:hypothetical protein
MGDKRYYTGFASLCALCASAFKKPACRAVYRSPFTVYR